jgi:pimeloyl-ACP methyl ester carboxylesterase
LNSSDYLWRYASILLFSGTLLAGCSSTPVPEQPSVEQTRREVQAYIESERVVDERGRFREIYCSVLEERGNSVPDYRPCDEALRITGYEAGATGEPVNLGQTQSDYLFLMVPGLGWNCFADWMDLSGSAPKHVASFGYDFRMVPVDGLSSTKNNARMIRDYVAGLPEADAGRPIILAGYSKGAPDILEAVVAYPELAERVAAVVSIAGAVHGSPLAADATQAQANMLTMVPGSACEEEHGDNDAVLSLKPEVRRQWLQENPLPPHIRYYSVVTFPAEERVSWALKNSYILLGESDIRNDTQVIIFDQMIPGSTIMAIVNADHWAIAVPVARSHPLFGGTLIDKNDYPREAFLEAMVRYLEEQLSTSQ